MGHMSFVADRHVQDSGEVTSAEYILVEDGSPGGISPAVEMGASCSATLACPFGTLAARKPLATALNLGVQLASAQYVALVTSDTRVTNGWLQPLLDTLGSSDSIGIVRIRPKTTGCGMSEEFVYICPIRQVQDSYLSSEHG